MKDLLVTLSLFFAVLTANAQKPVKTFLNSTFNPTDSLRATHYTICTHVSDTAWVVKLYEMNDTIKQVDTYKDEKLSIPHGRFVYYVKLHSMPKPPNDGAIDTLNHVQTTGFYKDGVKDGVWTDYFKNGHIENITTYVKGKANGLHENYSFHTNTRTVKGNFKNDKKDGEWDVFNLHGDVVEKGIYRDGELMSDDKITVRYIGAVPPKGLSEYINQKLDALIPAGLSGDLLIGFDVTVEGKLINVNLIGFGLNHQFDENVMQVIASCPAWKPAHHGKLKQLIQDGAALSLKISDGNISVKSVGTDAQKGMFYEMTH